MATATARTPAQLLKAYDAVQARTGVHPDILEELTKTFDYTDGFTNEAKCDEVADNMNDLLDLAGYDDNEPVMPPAPVPETPAPKAVTPASSKGKKANNVKNVKDSKNTNKGSGGKKTAPTPTKSATTKKPAPQLLAGLDDEACRLLVKENDRQARQRRNEAELAEFKSAQLKAGKSAEEVEALTAADMKQKRTLTDVAKGASENLVHNIARHLGSKSAKLKSLPERYEKLRSDLEETAAQHVADFAKKEAQWVNDSLLKAIKEADEEVPDAK